MLTESELEASAQVEARKSASQAEKRAHLRAVVVWRGRILQPNNQFLESRVVDVSEAGCGLEADRSFPVGTALNVLIAVPDLANRAQHHILKINATVRFHVMKPNCMRMGVQFNSLAEEHRQLLADWVEKTARR
jgi:hypothetical protein